MDSYAQRLLKRQPFLRARERVLMTWIESVVTRSPNEEDIIEEITFSHSTVEAIQHIPSQKSRTEYAALNMERLQKDALKIQEEKVQKWKKELATIRYYLVLIDAMMLALTAEERVLVERHYYEKKSLEALSQVPLTDVIRSRSTLKRMLKNIWQKADEVLVQEMD